MSRFISIKPTDKAVCRKATRRDLHYQPNRLKSARKVSQTAASEREIFLRLRERKILQWKFSLPYFSFPKSFTHSACVCCMYTEYHATKICCCCRSEFSLALSTVSLRWVRHGKAIFTRTFSSRSASSDIHWISSTATWKIRRNCAKFGALRV